MIDAKHLTLTEAASHGVVDLPVARQVVPQRFFQHDACARVVESGCSELLAHGREQRGCGGHVHHHGVGLAGLKVFAQALVIGGLGQIRAHVVQHLRKAIELLILGAFFAFDLGKALANQLAVLRVTQVVAGHAGDAPIGGQAAVAKGLKQGGHELAPCQIAGAAKENKVKAHGSHAGIAKLGEECEEWGCVSVTKFHDF